MSRQLFRRSLLVLLLVLFTLPAGAVERPGLDLRMAFQGWLTALWNAAGCVIDPNGHCLAQQAPAAGGPRDEGCAIDPNGRCLAQEVPAAGGSQDAGCGVDPHGGCAF
jgi:hypothetical protein